MKRLVAIDLWNRNIVLEFPGEGLVELVQYAHRGVAGREVSHNNPEAIEVGDLGKGKMLFVHLSIDGIQRLFPAVDLNGNTGRHKPRFDFRLYALDDVTSATTRTIDCL